VAKRIVFILLVSFGFVLPAVAEIGSGDKQPFQNDVQDPCPTYDACTMYKYSYFGPTVGYKKVPSACKQPGGCRFCNTNNRCQTIAMDGGTCTCTDLNVQGAPGITQCGEQYGSCVVN